MQFYTIYLLITTLAFGSAEFAKDYDGYKVYQVSITNENEAKFLDNFRSNEEFDFWTKHTGTKFPHEIMVSPVAQYMFEEVLESHNLSYKIINENVKDSLQVGKNNGRQTKAVPEGEVSFTQYMRHDEINAYLRKLEREYPDIVKTEVIGKSFEGRDLLLIEISSGGSNKPTIFADAGIHAREWAAPATALYIINQLVENPANSRLHENVKWALIPVANPDGYEFTHTSERLWRKTRSPGTICHGVDPNRNFDFHWSETGSSFWQCTNIYAGRHAFSEVETQALRNYLTAHKDDIKLYVAIHSCGRWILHPWAYRKVYADNNSELLDLGKLAANAIEAFNGTTYDVKHCAEFLGEAAGGSDDYAKGLGIQLAYTFELPCGGKHKFDPPPEAILPIVTETWEGFKAFHTYIENKFVTT